MLGLQSLRHRKKLKNGFGTKKAAGEQRIQIGKWISLTHPRKRIMKEKKAQLSTWYGQMTKKCKAWRSGFYFFSFKTQIDPLLDKTKKFYALRSYQLKTRHSVIGTFFKRIRIAENAKCWWYGDAKQSVMHLYIKCRKSRTKRQILKKSLSKAGIQWQKPPKKSG